MNEYRFWREKICNLPMRLHISTGAVMAYQPERKENINQKSVTTIITVASAAQSHCPLSSVFSAIP